MTPEEALAFLRKQTSNLRETRVIHRKVEEALEVLEKALEAVK